MSQSADTACMIDVQYELQQLHENPEWLTVLKTYDRLITSSKKTNPESEGWMTRLREFDGVEPEDLSHIHGSLIAHGFLRFQIADRTSGMEYRLSQLGKQALTRPFVPEQDEQTADGLVDVSDVVTQTVDDVVTEQPEEIVSEQDENTVVTEVTAESTDEAASDEPAESTERTDVELVQNQLVEGTVETATTTDVNSVDSEPVESSVSLECPQPQELVQLTFDRVPQPIMVDQPQPAAVTKSVLEFPLPIIELDDLKKSA